MPFVSPFGSIAELNFNPASLQLPQNHKPKPLAQPSQTPNQTPKPMAMPEASSPEAFSTPNFTAMIKPVLFAPPQGQALASASKPSSAQGVAISQSAPGTGPGQIPGWIQSQLNSGQIASWTNPATGVTYWAPGAFGTTGIYAHTIWQSGPTGSGPLGSVGTVTVTTPTTTIKQGNTVLYSGPTSSAPNLQFNAQGKFTGVVNPTATTTFAATPTATQTAVSTTSTTSNYQVDYPTFGQNAKITCGPTVPE